MLQATHIFQSCLNTADINILSLTTPLWATPVYCFPHMVWLIFRLLRLILQFYCKKKNNVGQALINVKWLDLYFFLILIYCHGWPCCFVAGLIDNSGLRLFYTPVLRKYDAGVIEAGLWVSLFHNIPPGMPEFVSEGHCTLECLEEVCVLSETHGFHALN